jgi:hypothetical protein
MATLTVQDLSIAGLAPVYSAVSSSDEFPNDGRTVIYVKNGGGSPDTVAIDSLEACNQGSDHNGGSAVTNGTEKCFGPFSMTRFNNSNGRVTITHSFTTSVTCAVLRLPAA